MHAREPRRFDPPGLGRRSGGRRPPADRASEYRTELRGHASAAVPQAREGTASACGISPHHLAEVLRTLARAGHLESCAAQAEATASPATRGA